MKRSIFPSAIFFLAAAVAADSFLPLDRTGAAALADPAGHDGPTVIALWSSECIHCKKNLALFAAMANRLPELQVITVATEPVERALAEPLDGIGVPGGRYAYGADAPEAIAWALDRDWYGELPRTLFFDGRGGRVARSGVVDEEFARRALGLE